MDGPCGGNSDAKNSTNGAGIDNRRECFIIINAMLRVSMTDPAGFIAGEAPVKVEFLVKDPFVRNDICIGRMRK